MRRLTAFFTALCLFALTVIGIHNYSMDAIAMNNGSFSTWPAKCKFESPTALRANMNENTMPVFGSSEFQHGLTTKYHPMTMFKDCQFRPMLIGAGYYQSLGHAITLGAISSELKGRKVVILLSPTWFRKGGVKDKAFASRFSESSYIDMIKSPNVPDSVKDYIAARTQKLLAVDETTLNRIREYTPDKEPEKYSKTWLYREFLKERQVQGVVLEAAAWGIFKNPESVESGRIGETLARRVMKGLGKLKARESSLKISRVPRGNEKLNKKYNSKNWESLAEEADKWAEVNCNNPFYMSKLGYFLCRFKMKGGPKPLKDVDCYVESEEYDDFRAFLDICKANDIKPLIVELPVNGYWYEYQGYPKETRVKYYEKIKELAGEYGYPVEDLSGYEFEKYFFADAVHPDGKGWVKVNEIVYNYYKEG